MHHHTSRYTLIGLLALALTWASAAFGQGVTTGGINGLVTTKDGKPVVGATITALHVPSGTRSVTTTNADGRYSFDGLRTGGPYTVTATASGLTPVSQTGYYIDISQEVNADFTLSSEVVQMEAVTVAGSTDTTFDASAMGTGAMFNTQQIGQISSVRSDISDIINLDPRASVMQAGTSDEEYTISFEGQNPRENLILIDGVSATDNFGLNSNGYAGLRNPVPFEWIESAAVILDDYDLVYSGFAGGAVDFTVKSGTNDFHGSLYAEYEGSQFRGPDPVVGVLGAHEQVQDHTTGGTFGGPIIKNKLFFFFGYEAFREISAPPAQNFNPVDNATDAGVIGQVVAKAEGFGYNPGSFVAVNHTWDQNAVAKIDWNITDAHKFEFTFRHTAGFSPIFYNYTSATETSLSASWYSSYRVDQSYTAKFNSDWSYLIPGLKTEIEGTYKRYNGTAQYNGQDFPAITIDNITGTSTTDGAGYTNGKLFLGRYYAYQLNNIYTWEQEEHAYADYSIGNHTFKFGASFDRTAYTDTFIPNYLGSYIFANVADFLNATPTYVNLETPANGFTLGNDVSHYYLLDMAPLIQDTWKPNGQLTILGGVRLDDPYEPQSPPFSQTFYNAWGYANNTTMNNNYSISPRIGFNYELPTQEKTQIRGGAGLFLGANPVVWVENSFNNAGQLNNYSLGSTSTSAAPISSTYTFTGNQATQALPPTAPGTANPSYDITASNFHWPANWKENIAIDRQLPWLDMTFTAEVDITQVQKDIIYQELNLQQATTGPLTTPDGAIRYAGNITANMSGDTLTSSGSITTPFANSHSGQVYELTNTDKGGSQEYTLEVARPMKDDWSFSFAYTHTHATQVDQLYSSVASSNFEDQYYVNPNDNIPYRSQFATPDKFIFEVAREFHFFPEKAMPTTISAQFIAETGQAFSYLFYGDADGSGGENQDLFYVPTGPNDPKVTWSSPTEEAAFFQYLAGTPSLEKYAGQIAPRNAFYSGEQHTVNLHVEQGLPVWDDTVRLTLFADCFNFANLIDRSWGIVSNYDPDFESVTVAGADYLPTGNNGQGQYVYRFNSTTFTGGPTTFSDMSRWAIQVGARLEF